MHEKKRSHALPCAMRAPKKSLSLRTLARSMAASVPPLFVANAFSWPCLLARSLSICPRAFAPTSRQALRPPSRKAPVGMLPMPSQHQASTQAAPWRWRKCCLRAACLLAMHFQAAACPLSLPPAPPGGACKKPRRLAKKVAKLKKNSLLCKIISMAHKDGKTSQKYCE